jgi:hypothetical protein
MKIENDLVTSHVGIENTRSPKVQWIHEIKLVSTTVFCTAVISSIWPIQAGLVPTVISPALLHGGLFSLLPFLSTAIPIVLTAALFGTGMSLLLSAGHALAAMPNTFDQPAPLAPHDHPSNPTCARQLIDDQPPSYSQAMQHKQAEINNHNFLASLN